VPYSPLPLPPDDDIPAFKKSRPDRPNDDMEVSVPNPVSIYSTNNVKHDAQRRLTTELRRLADIGLPTLSSLQQKAFLNKARDEIEKVDTGSTFQRIKNIKSIKPVRAPRKNVEADAEEGLLTPSRSGIILDTYESFFKENSESRKTIAEIESRHREELIKRDREIVNVNLQLQHEKQKKQDSSAIHNLKVQIEREKKARHAAEKRLEGDVAALKSQHKTKVAELSDLYEKKFSESWKRREDKEKRQAEIAAAKLRDEEEKLQQTKLAKREKLEAKAKQLNDGILQLINRERDGTLALTQDSEILSQNACLDGLVDLWKSNGTTLCSILPHRLMNDLDYALEFEVEVIITARVYMLNLQLRGFEPKELLGTNWSPSAIDRFKNGLVPYHYDTELSDMSVAVCNIHQILQQAVAGMRASQLTIATCEQHFAPPAGSDNATSPQSLAIQPLFTPDLPTFKVTQPTPLIPPLNTKTWQVDSSVAPMNRNTTGYQAYVPDTIHQPPPATPSFGFTPPPVQPPPAQPPRDEQKRICLNMSKKGFCRFGNNCKFSHDVPVPQPASHLQPPPQHGPTSSKDIDMTDLPANAHVKKRAAKPCNNVGKFGVCKKADCPYMHPPGKHMGAAAPAAGPTNNTWQPNQPLIFGEKSVGIPARPCWNEQNGKRCTMNSCTFSHQFPHGANNEMPMTDAGDSTFEGIIAGFSANPNPNPPPVGQCFNERDRGRCNKLICKFVHTLPHGPLNTGYAASNAGMSIKGAGDGLNTGTIPKHCKFERDNGRCTNSRCRYAHMNPHGTTTNSRLDEGYDADEGSPPGNFVGNVLTNRTTWDDGCTNPFAPPPLAPLGHRSRRNSLAPSNFGYLNKSLQERITRDNDAFVPPLGPRNRIGDHPGFLPSLHDRGRNDSFNPPTGPRKRNNNNRGAGSLASRMSFTGGHPAAGLLEQASMSALGRKLGQGGNDHHRKKKGKKHGQGRRNGGGGGGGGGVMLGGDQW
jgi:hypothetical protein